jgi:hypothetical protein
MTILSRLFSPAPRRPAPTTRQGRSDFLDAVGKAADSLQKYQDVPLRLHKQWLATFLAILLLFGVVSGIYLNVTANTAIAGREIQNMEADIITNQRLNADLQTLIAGTLSNISLEERAAAEGFVPVTRENIKYLIVPGYTPSTGPDLLTSAPAAATEKLPSEYTETLFTWLARQLDAASTPLARTQ